MSNELMQKNADIEAICKYESWAKTQPQVFMDTIHTFWAGCYARTIMVPKDTIMTGVQIAIDTMLIVHGDISIGGNRVTGHHVLKGLAGRKNIFLAHRDTYLTMVFASEKTNVADVEKEFTQEPENLGSRKYKQEVAQCQVGQQE